MASPDHDKSSHPPPDDANPPENENEIAVLDVTGANEVQPLRRSGRRPLPSSRLESLDPTRTPEPRPSKIPAAVDETGRNPKRKTRESQKCHIDIPSNLLSEALKPLEAKDIEEWEGWIELESEPVSHRNFTLRIIATFLIFKRTTTNTKVGILQYHITGPRCGERQGTGAIQHRPTIH